MDLSGDKTDFFNVSYDVLARKGTLGERHPRVHNVRLDSGDEGRSPYTSWIATINGAEYNILMITPKTWGSPASKLADLILDRPSRRARQAAGAGWTPSSQRRVMRVDRPERALLPHLGLRLPEHAWAAAALLPQDLDAGAGDAWPRRAAPAATTKGVPRTFYTRITNPELNNFLLAPLAKSAGGTEACGRAVFASTDDPDYQAILKTFEPVAALLKRSPRDDMPGALPVCRADAVALGHPGASNSDFSPASTRD